MATVTVSSSPPVDPLAAAAGLVNWCDNPLAWSNSSALGTQVIYAAGVWLPSGASISNVVLFTNLAAVGAAPTGAFVAIADATSIKAQSGNIAANGAWGVVGMTNLPLGGAGFVTQAAGIHYAVVLVNGTWGTTQPTFARGGFGGTQARLANTGPWLFAGLGTGQTALPANGAALTFAAATLNFWAGFS